MSDITLSASVRQNLLSLQSTATLLSRTQDRLSTGNKVNSALDNPTNYFTAQGLNNRASDINNLLDSIGNGVQVIQAANTGITSLQSLVDSAKSIANQALQAPTGYSTKSNMSVTLDGATSDDLRGATSYQNTIASSNVLYTGAAGGTTAATATATLDGTAGTFTGTAVTGATAATTLIGTGGVDATGAIFKDGASLSVNGHTVTFKSGDAPAASGVPAGSGVSGNIVTDGQGNSTVYLGSTGTPDATVGDVLTAVDLASGAISASITAGAATIGTAVSTVNGTNQVVLQSSTGGAVNVSGTADMLGALGLTAATGSGIVTVSANPTTSAASLGTLIKDGSTLTVNGKTITFKNAAAPTASTLGTGYSENGNLVTDGDGNSTVYLQGGTVGDVLNAVDLATGVQTVASVSSGTATLQTTSGDTKATIVNGALQVSTGATSDLKITGTGNALSALGLTGNTGMATSFTAKRSSTPGSLDGKTLSFSAFNGGTAVSVTFGDGTNGTVRSLADLNDALKSDNLIASFDNSTGKLTVSASNDYASTTLGSTESGGVIGGDLASLDWSEPSDPVQDPTSQSTRANLVSQYNNIIDQITATAQDASFNGVNLLNGDQLKMVFDETGKSSLTIAGVTFDPAGLGLAKLTAGTDFVDNASTNKILTNLNTASTTLRTEASALGSNLSVVQVRQDFSKNLINVLQTGASNLTLADTNEEAANSQALSTRQSIAVSALSLANQSQQSVLRLLQ